MGSTLGLGRTSSMAEKTPAKAGAPKKDEPAKAPNKDEPAKAEAKKDEPAKAEAKQDEPPKPEAEPKPEPAETAQPAKAQDNVGEDQQQQSPPSRGEATTTTAEPSATYAVLIPAAEIETGDPEASAPPPGVAPPGDARSLRRGNDFCLVYRDKAFLVTRVGVVGKAGVWTRTEYPSIGAAAHAYAQTCSRFASEGYLDYR